MFEPRLINNKCTENPAAPAPGPSRRAHSREQSVIKVGMINELLLRSSDRTTLSISESVSDARVLEIGSA